MRLFLALSSLSLSSALVAKPYSGPISHSSKWLSKPSKPFSPILLVASSSSSFNCSGRHYPFSNDLHSIIFAKKSRYCRRNATSKTALSAKTTSVEEKKKAVIATCLLLFLDSAFRILFTKYSISFPSSLAGCGALFASMLALNELNEESGGGGLGEQVYNLLNPGANLLAKWLPVFFVPGLITLPLASGLGNALEVLKIVSVIIGGFYFTLFTTAGSVFGTRKLLTVEEPIDPSTEFSMPDVLAPTAPVSNPPAKPFSNNLYRALKSIACLTGISTVALVKKCPGCKWITPVQSAFLLSTTLATFVMGANLPKSFIKKVHPLVTCTALTWVWTQVVASLTGSTFLTLLKSYKTGSLGTFSAGAGDVLLYLLGPAVVSLACQMYGRKKLMRENIPEVGISTLVSSLGGLYGTAAAVRLLNIGNNSLRLSLLSRNITSPLAMAIASILGANGSLAVTIVVLTGLFGANFGASILDSFGINDAVARGLGIGAAAHGLGTAAFSKENDAFPFAAIAMALTASACTVLISIPFVKQSVLKLALGV